MDKFKLVEKLKDKANINYEEAKNVLEKNNWDILDSIIYLEEIGRIEKPSVGVFYTNDSMNYSKEQLEVTSIVEIKKE